MITIERLKELAKVTMESCGGEVSGALRELIVLRHEKSTNVRCINARNKINRWWEPLIVCDDEMLEKASDDIQHHRIDIIEYRKILYGDRYKDAHGI